MRYIYMRYVVECHSPWCPCGYLYIPIWILNVCSKIWYQWCTSNAQTKILLFDFHSILLTFNLFYITYTTLGEFKMWKLELFRSKTNQIGWMNLKLCNLMIFLKNFFVSKLYVLFYQVLLLPLVSHTENTLKIGISELII